MCGRTNYRPAFSDLIADGFVDDACDIRLISSRPVRVVRADGARNLRRDPVRYSTRRRFAVDLFSEM